MNINERIQIIVNELFNGNKAAFAKCIEVKPTTVSNIIGRERASKPSSEILESIAYNIPNLNPDWLLTGQGSMLKSVTSNFSNSFVGDGNKNIQVGHGSKTIRTNESDKDAVSALEKQILILEGELKSKDKEIEGLQKEVIGLQQQLALKNEMIALLQDAISRKV